MNLQQCVLRTLIGEAFSAWKNTLKSYLEIHQQLIMDNTFATEAGMNMVNWRQIILKELPAVALSTITNAHNVYYNFFMKPCNNLETM